MKSAEFYAKTFVTQCKGYKRFRIEGMYYSALDTLNQAHASGVITCDEWKAALAMFDSFLFD